MISNQRTDTVKKNIVATVIVRILSMFTSFLLIPITLNYITKDIYGIWLTISSIYAFLSILDVGLGNGLRIKLGTSLANDNKLLARYYVSTAYYYFPLILFPVSILIYLLIPCFSWDKVFHVSASYQSELIVVIRIIVIGFSVRVYLSLLNSVLSALQKTRVISIIDFFVNLLAMGAIMIAGRLGHIDLRCLAIIYSIVPIVLLIIFSIVYWCRNNYIFPKLSYARNVYFKDILSLGCKYFVIQILALITLSSGNFIIVSLSTAGEVFDYNMVQKYFSIVLTLYTFIVVPLVPAFNDAYYSGDISWIHTQMSRLKKIWLGSFLLVVLLIVCSGLIFKVWLGNHSDVSLVLIIMYGIYAILNGLSSIFSSFINGIGDTNVQMIIGVVNVSLMTFGVYYLMSYFDLGAVGYVMISIVSMMVSAVLLRLRYNKIMNKYNEEINDSVV